MKRRNFLKGSQLLFSGLLLSGGTANAMSDFSSQKSDRKRKLSFTIGHITDVHMPDEEIPRQKFGKCIDLIKKHKVDFFLNTGDSVMSIDGKDIVRETVLSQWKSWDQCMERLKDYEIYSCIGNHDIWWAAPNKEDEMYGVEYAAKRLKLPNRYYSFSKKNWKFIVLDGNNNGISLDEPQMKWLESELENSGSAEHILIMAHYPILTVTNTWEGGQFNDHIKLKDLFYKHKNKVKVCISGHQHLVDNAEYNQVKYFCNGSMSGFWWGEGNKDSAARGFYQESPAGYAILRLYDNGDVENQYIPHNLI